MAKGRTTQDNPEDYVKNYQLEITNGKVDAVLLSIQQLQKQVSDFATLIQTRPTNEQVDDKISSAVANMEKDLNTARRELELQFGPAIKTSNRLLWGILSSGLALLVAMGMVIIGFFSK